MPPFCMSQWLTSLIKGLTEAALLYVTKAYIIDQGLNRGRPFSQVSMNVHVSFQRDYVWQDGNEADIHSLFLQHKPCADDTSFPDILSLIF